MPRTIGSRTGLMQIERQQGIIWGDGGLNDVALWFENRQLFTDGDGLISRNGPEIDPRAWGVFCDGVTDDTVAFQALLDAIPVGGATVRIPSGKQALVSGLLVKQDWTAVVSSGGGGLKGTGKNIRIIATNGHNHVTFQGLRVTGQGKDDGGSSSGRGALHIGNNDERCKAIGNIVEQANGTGIVDDGNHSLVALNEILETGEHGIYSSGAIGSRYVGNYIRDAGKNCALTSGNILVGFRYSTSTGCTAVGNVIEDTVVNGVNGNSGYGFTAEGPSSDCAFVGNTIKNSYGRDAYIATGNDCVFSGNTIYSTRAGDDSILVAGGTRNVVADNHIYRAAAGGSAIRWNTAGALGYDLCHGNVCVAAVAIGSGSPAIWVNSATPVGISIVDNLVTVAGSGSWGHGIDVDAGASGTQIGGNQVNATTPYTDAGSGTIWDQVSGIASKTWDPPSVADKSSATTTIAVANCHIGDYVSASLNIDQQGMTLAGCVSADGTVTVVLMNNTGGAVDLASSTLKVTVRAAR